MVHFDPPKYLLCWNTLFITTAFWKNIILPHKSFTLKMWLVIFIVCAAFFPWDILGGSWGPQTMGGPCSVVVLTACLLSWWISLFFPLPTSLLSFLHAPPPLLPSHFSLLWETHIENMPLATKKLSSGQWTRGKSSPCLWVTPCL